MFKPSDPFAFYHYNFEELEPIKGRSRNDLWNQLIPLREFASELWEWQSKCKLDHQPCGHKFHPASIKLANSQVLRIAVSFDLDPYFIVYMVEEIMFGSEMYPTKYRATIPHHPAAPIETMFEFNLNVLRDALAVVFGK